MVIGLSLSIGSYETLLGDGRYFCLSLFGTVVDERCVEGVVDNEVDDESEILGVSIYMYARKEELKVKRNLDRNYWLWIPE